MKIIVTGGAGFIGSALIRMLIRATRVAVVNVDKLTYAGRLAALASVCASDRYAFERVDVCDAQAIARVLRQHQPDGIMHLAAESHVDRSIDDASVFIQTNIVGTHTLLHAATAYWRGLARDKQAAFRFHHISTDEVYGDLETPEAECFTEASPYRPSSPYAASKASADHLVRAWQRTYGLPTLISNCSNNYGPWQFPEKLIPRVILNALAGKPLPVYGQGAQVRDWLFVEDHVEALYAVFTRGRVGQTYNIGGHNVQQNIQVVCMICALLDAVHPQGAPHARWITHVQDRPGHDLRYAIDASKIRRELGWTPRETFASGLRKTVLWYRNQYETLMGQ